MSQAHDARSVADPPEADATHISLLVRLKANEAAAWNRLVVLYAPMVYYWCRKCDLADQDADDIFQEVFQSVAVKIASFRKERPGDTFRGWLRVITQNKIHDHFRRLRREPQGAGGTEANQRLTQLPDVTRPDDDGDEKRAYRQLTHRALELIRGEFAPRTWQAFWRVTVDGQRPVDVAEELAMQSGAVRVAKSRVLRRLRQELGDILD